MACYRGFVVHDDVLKSLIKKGFRSEAWYHCIFMIIKLSNVQPKQIFDVEKPSSESWVWFKRTDTKITDQYVRIEEAVSLLTNRCGQEVTKRDGKMGQHTTEVSASAPFVDWQHYCQRLLEDSKWTVIRRPNFTEPWHRRCHEKMMFQARPSTDFFIDWPKLYHRWSSHRELALRENVFCQCVCERTPWRPRFGCEQVAILPPSNADYFAGCSDTILRICHAHSPYQTTHFRHLLALPIVQSKWDHR